MRSLFVNTIASVLSRADSGYAMQTAKLRRRANIFAHGIRSRCICDLFLKPDPQVRNPSAFDYDNTKKEKVGVLMEFGLACGRAGGFFRLRIEAL